MKKLLLQKDKHSLFGMLTLETEEKIYAAFPCKCGSGLDDTAYGGKTPSGMWIMTEPIARRRAPASGRVYNNARIYPIETSHEWWRKYRLRRFPVGEEPFMIHGCSNPGTCSTGCIAITENWANAIKIINQAYEEQDELLTIEVKQI